MAFLLSSFFRHMLSFYSPGTYVLSLFLLFCNRSGSTVKREYTWNRKKEQERVREKNSICSLFLFVATLSLSLSLHSVPLSSVCLCVLPPYVSNVRFTIFSLISFVGALSSVFDHFNTYSISTYCVHVCLTVKHCAHITYGDYTKWHGKLKTPKTMHTMHCNYI